MVQGDVLKQLHKHSWYWDQGPSSDAYVCIMDAEGGGGLESVSWIQFLS